MIFNDKYGHSRYASCSEGLDDCPAELVFGKTLRILRGIVTDTPLRSLYNKFAHLRQNMENI